MFKKITIRNYKSIRDVSFNSKKLNVIIGEPNSGKSNIIEALAMKSSYFVDELNMAKDTFRFNAVQELFYDYNLSKPIEIITDSSTTRLSYGWTEHKKPDNTFIYYNDYESNDKGEIIISHEGNIQSNRLLFENNIRFYEFKRLKRFKIGYLSYLSTPNGDNLPGLLLSSPKLKSWVSDFVKEKGLTLTLKPVEYDLSISKFVEDSVYSYPYFSLSETFQRIIFYNIAIKSNEDSVLLFDEPESNTFPFYTKHLAETIALDETNQFFITTHNPYLLLSLIEKSKKENIAVFIAKMENYETKLIELDEKQITKVLDFNSDVFFNFDSVLEK